VAIGGALALVVVAAVVGTTQLAFENASEVTGIPKQTEPSLDTRVEIAARFAPVLELDSHELFVPIDRDAYVSATELDARTGKLASLLNAAPTPASLPSSEGECVRSAHCFYFLNIKGLEPPHSKPPAYKALQDKVIAADSTNRIYFHVTRYDETGDYAVQYWFLYFFNYRLNLHESHWEQITLHLDPDQKPIEALYSSHASGQNRPWRKIETVGDHPVVYVALGSHANYFRRGTHRVTLDCRVVLHTKVCTGNETIRDTSDGRGQELRPEHNYKLRELTGAVYIGSFGSGNYVFGKRKDEILADPRARAVWLNPLARFRLAKNAPQN
jgi:hypothetical protein